MFETVIASLVVAYLPGALVFRAPIGARELRVRLTSEERAFWAVVLSVSWSLGVVLAMASVGVFTFRRLIVVNTVLSALVLIVWRGRLGFAGTAARATWSALIPVGLVALGAYLYFPSAEYVIGGKDPGTYLNEGVQIAQRGSLVVVDPVVASVPAASRQLFFPWHRTPYYYGLRFMGFFIRDPGTGEVVGQFPHLFPASIAIVYGLNGLSGARDAVAAWALLGLVAVYLVGARLIGPVASAAACVLLAINVVQVWFARYPNSETVMQALLFAAVLAFARAAEGHRHFFGTIAGILLGLMLFLRYDVVLAMAAFGAAAALLPVGGQRAGIAFGVSLVGTALVGLWYLANPMIAYAAYPLGFTRDRGGWWLVAAALAGIVLFRWVIRRERAAAAVRWAVPAGLAVSLTALAVYAYFFRDMTGRTALHDAIAFRTFAWYVTPWVVAAAVAGMGVLTWTRFWRDPAFFLTLSTFSVFFFYKTRIVPEHFWAARRFLAVILPGAMLVVAGLAALAIERGRRAVAGRGSSAASAVPSWRSQAVASLLLVLVLTPVGMSFWHSAARVRGHVEYAGMIPRLERLAAAIGPRDLLLVESRDAGSDLHVLALPLAYIYAKNVLVLESAVPAKRSLENFVAWAETRYANVLFLGGGGTDLLTRRLAAEPVSNDQFRVAEYESRTNAYPEGIRRKDFEFGIYRLGGRERMAGGPVDVGIGLLDDLNVVRFHARERRGESGATFRWTGPQSFVLLLGIAPDARQITVWMGNGGRPAQAPPAIVEVALGEIVLGSATVANRTQPYTFDLPPDVAARAAASDDPERLRLRSTTWVPATVIGGSDTRELGVIVTRVQVQ